jgi:ATP-dependent Clp protease protease subunit
MPDIVPFKGVKSTLRVRAEAGIGEIDLFGVVGGDWFGEGITKEQFAAVLRELGGVKQINLRLSSPGGDVHDGRAIANMIRQHSATVAVNVLAEASSIASIIALAGDSVQMSQGAVMLIHRCSVLNYSNAPELEALARDLRTIDDEMISTYQAKTKMSRAAIAALMDENRYMSASEAKQKGFADTLDAPAAAASGYQIAAADRQRLHLPPLPPDHFRQAAAIAAVARGRSVIR